MDDKKTIEALLRKMVFPILALVYLAQVYACRGIYADGSDNLFKILNDNGFVLTDTRRVVHHFIIQAPTVLLLKLGVTNLVFLRTFFSGWLLLCPLAVWCASFWKLRNDILYWPFVLVFCFVYFNTCFFSIGEFGLCFAIAAYCFASLAGTLPASRLQRGALLVAAAALLFNYPSTVFHGSLLFLLVLIKPRAEWNGASQAYKYALGFLFAGSVATALWSILAPSDAKNFAEARDPTFALQDIEFRCLFAYAAIVSLLYFMRQVWMWIAVVLCCATLIVLIDHDQMRLAGYPHYLLRAYVAMALAVCGVGLWLFYWMVRRQPPAFRQRVFLLPAVLAIAVLARMSWFDVGMSLDYANYLDIFRQTVNSRTGLISYMDSGLSALDYERRFSWGWTYPVTSVLLRADSHKGVILNPDPYHGYQPFDPLTNMPDLDRYYH